MSDRKRHKSSYYYKKRTKHYLEAGICGFFCTCNFREKDCVKEAYNILNEYADHLYGPEARPSNDKTENSGGHKENDDSEDISDILEQELKSLKEDKEKKVTERRFQAVETGANNCVFIRTNLTNPEELASKIFSDLVETKTKKTRFLLRLLPIMATCKANLEDIKNTAGKLFDNYFLHEPSTFAVVLNKRYNNSIHSMDIIKELADIITFKNCNNKADLKHPKLAVIVEIIKGICLLSVVHNFYEYKKYNLFEISKDQTDTNNEITQNKVDSEDVQNVDTPEVNTGEKEDPK